MNNDERETSSHGKKTRQLRCGIYFVFDVVFQKKRRRRRRRGACSDSPFSLSPCVAIQSLSESAKRNEEATEKWTRVVSYSIRKSRYHPRVVVLFFFSARFSKSVFTGFLTSSRHQPHQRRWLVGCASQSALGKRFPANVQVFHSFFYRVLPSFSTPAPSTAVALSQRIGQWRQPMSRRESGGGGGLLVVVFCYCWTFGWRRRAGGRLRRGGADDQRQPRARRRLHQAVHGLGHLDHDQEARQEASGRLQLHGPAVEGSLDVYDFRLPGRQYRPLRRQVSQIWTRVRNSASITPTFTYKERQPKPFREFLVGLTLPYLTQSNPTPPNPT